MGLRCAGRGCSSGREVTVDATIGVVVTFRPREGNVPDGIFVGLHCDGVNTANAAAKEKWFRIVGIEELR